METTPPTYPPNLKGNKTKKKAAQYESERGAITKSPGKHRRLCSPPPLRRSRCNRHRPSFSLRLHHHIYSSSSSSSLQALLNVISTKDGRDLNSASSESPDSKSCSSSPTSSVSSAGSHTRKIRLITARLRRKLQVSRKGRTKVSFISKPIPGKNDSTSSVTSSMKPISSLTSTSSDSTVAEIGSLTEIDNKPDVVNGKKCIRPTHISLRAEAILKLLSEGSACETKIRKELSDSPDTRKALRMTNVKLFVFLPTAEAGRGQAIGERWTWQSIYLPDSTKGLVLFSRLK